MIAFRFAAIGFAIVALALSNGGYLAGPTGVAGAVIALVALLPTTYHRLET